MIEDNMEEDKSELGEAETGSKNFLIPGSIVLGAIIIAATILYNGKQVTDQLDAGFSRLSSLSQGQAAPAAQGQQQQQQQAAAPTGPVNVAERKDAPVLGSSSAKVTMVEFADFQCPFCQNFFKNTFPDIKSKYIDTGKVKVVFRHFPLPFHVNAQISAVAAECANQQGKFWPFHDMLYNKGQSDGTNLDKGSLKKYADSLGLNSGTFGFGKNKFNQCLENNSTLATVQADISEGTKDGVNGTPTFYINGTQVVGAQPLAIFTQAIDDALKK